MLSRIASDGSTIASSLAEVSSPTWGGGRFPGPPGPAAPEPEPAASSPVGSSPRRSVPCERSVPSEPWPPRSPPPPRSVPSPAEASVACVRSASDFSSPSMPLVLPDSAPMRRVAGL